MTASSRADMLRQRLFALVGEFKDFVGEIRAARAGKADARLEAGLQADNVACALAAVHSRISGPSPEYDLFIDSARDPKDRSFDFRLPDGVVDDLPDRLKSLRESAGLTREQLADAAGLTRQAVHNYETGDRRPTWDAIQAIATALGVSTDVFRDKT